jgi:hypothetical protein
VSLEQLGSLEAHHGGSVCCTVGSGHCLGAQLLLSGNPQVKLCPEVALPWTDLATEWLPETEAPATTVTTNMLLFLYKLHVMRHNLIQSATWKLTDLNDS